MHPNGIIIMNFFHLVAVGCTSHPGVVVGPAGVEYGGFLDVVPGVEYGGFLDVVGTVTTSSSTSEIFMQSI